MSGLVLLSAVILGVALALAAAYSRRRRLWLLLFLVSLAFVSFNAWAYVGGPRFGVVVFSGAFALTWAFSDLAIRPSRASVDR